MAFKKIISSPHALPIFKPYDITKKQKVQKETNTAITKHYGYLTHP
jgi:hypothetical protein